jgi:hypothetical protein
MTLDRVAGSETRTLDSGTWLGCADKVFELVGSVEAACVDVLGGCTSCGFWRNEFIWATGGTEEDDEMRGDVDFEEAIFGESLVEMLEEPVGDVLIGDLETAGAVAAVSAADEPRWDIVGTISIALEATGRGVEDAVDWFDKVEE